MSCGRRPAPRNVVKWDVGRPAPRPPRTFAVMRSPADCCRGRRPRRPRRGQDPSLRCKRSRGYNGKAAGRACPAPTDYCERVAHERGARVAASPVQPHKNKKRDGHCPVSFFLKKKEKNRTSRRRLNANGTTPLQVIPSLRIRQGALVFFLFSCRSEALAFDVLIVLLFCRICKMRTCTTCYIYTTLFCIVCTIVHG